MYAKESVLNVSENVLGPVLSLGNSCQSVSIKQGSIERDFHIVTMEIYSYYRYLIMCKSVGCLSSHGLVIMWPVPSSRDAILVQANSRNV